MDYCHPSIESTACIARNATIVGDVVIGPDCTVLFNATVRGDGERPVVVGARSNIQENACIHVSHETVIGEDVSIGHGAIVHGCSIGDGCIIGMGAILLDGARVGCNCLVGAGALVTGSAVIPDGMLVIGSPAKAVRPLTEEELDSLVQNAEHYVNVGKNLVENGLLVEGNAYSMLRAL